MPSASGDIPPPTESVGLLCLYCNYDLTGLSEDRCPECGEAFDREVLRKIAAGEPIHAVPWDTDQSPRGFFKTWWLALTDRSSLAASFPPVHDVDRATGYSMLCYLVAILMVTVQILMMNRHGDPCGGVIVLWFIIFLDCLVCEMAIAFGLSRLLENRGIPRKYHFWRGLTHYLSGYTWLSATWILCMLFMTELGMPRLMAPIMLLCGVGIVLWWVTAFGAMAARRGESNRSVVLACAWVLLVSLVAISPIGLPFLMPADFS